MTYQAGSLTRTYMRRDDNSSGLSERQRHTRRARETGPLGMVQEGARRAPRGTPGLAPTWQDGAGAVEEQEQAVCGNRRPGRRRLGPEREQADQLLHRTRARGQPDGDGHPS